MIKVNLIIGRGGATAAGGGDGSGAGSTIVSDTSMSFQSLTSGVTNMTDLAIKAALAFVPVIGLMIFEEYQISLTTQKKTALDSQLADLETQRKALAPQIEGAKKLLEEKGRLQAQIETIRQLSTERLYNVKALSAIQQIIPSVTWLSSLKFDGTKVELTGKSMDDSSILDFVKKLSESVYFRNTELGNISDESNKDGSLKSFVIKSNLENL